jgi:hypothetical protein
MKITGLETLAPDLDKAGETLKTREVSRARHLSPSVTVPCYAATGRSDVRRHRPYMV